ncbi:hypothetical protein BDQ12DRAFT_222515 [Crucibulum laeve]|uniref:Uncharacterized protein n=1 Tax=Crucibulum laeve TaxID=68775 RepID=A0A5C3LX48_9AGAR|nr:hypothetical protein BDQ12DRAFT_222515 [Crucibulum laeve]
MGAGSSIENNPWLNPFPLSWETLPPTTAAVLVESLLYGMHVLLFFICCYILLRRRRPLQLVMLAAISVTFILASTDVAISWNIFIRHGRMLVESDTRWFLDQIYPKFLLHLANNFIADILLIIRCYVVWSRNKVLASIASVLLIVATIFGILSEGTKTPALKKFIPVYIFMIFIINLGLTGMMAGRIWFIARRVRGLLGHRWVKQYNTVVAIL